jgi:hypothetical protein
MWKPYRLRRLVRMPESADGDQRERVVVHAEGMFVGGRGGPGSFTQPQGTRIGFPAFAPKARTGDLVAKDSGPPKSNVG